MNNLMKRSVIKLAGRTLVLSLPSEWVKQNNIIKGDELDVQNRENHLVISKMNLGAIPVRIKLDISNFHSSIAWYYITSAYSLGTEEIEIYFSNPLIKNTYTQKEMKVKDYIANLVDELMGVEVVQEGKNTITIREISVPKIEEYNSMLRKIFLLLLSISEEKENSPDQLLREEKRINKYSHFCLRLLNRLNGTRQEYFIVRNLEEIGDELSKNIILNSNLGLKKKLNHAIREFYNAYYVPNPKNIMKFHAIRYKLKNELKNEKPNERIKFILDKMIECLNAKISTVLLNN